MGNVKVNWSVKQIYEGCLIASLAHAIMVAKYPDLSYEHSWDGFNYNVQDGEGGRATISFADGVCVGAFRLDSIISESLDHESALSETSPVIRKIAHEETLQYLLENVNGNIVPVVTTLIWAEGTGMFECPHEHALMIQKGGKLLERQTMEHSTAFQSWADYYEMTTEQVQLMEFLFQRMLSQPNTPITMTTSQVALLGEDDEGLEESRASFVELNIEWSLT
jgi:hypothetical protein